MLICRSGRNVLLTSIYTLLSSTITIILLLQVVDSIKWKTKGKHCTTNRNLYIHLSFITVIIQHMWTFVFIQLSYSHRSFSRITRWKVKNYWLTPINSNMTNKSNLTEHGMAQQNDSPLFRSHSNLIGHFSDWINVWFTYEIVTSMVFE